MGRLHVDRPDAHEAVAAIRADTDVWAIPLSNRSAGARAYFCIGAFSETDLTVDCNNIGIPTLLLLHGYDSRIVLIEPAVKKSVKLIPNAKLQVYRGAPHGMCSTLKDKVKGDLLAFASS